MFPRARGTILNMLLIYRKHPDHKNQRFKTEALNQRTTRVWRIT